MGTERKTFKYNGTTIFYWNRYSRKSFLDKAVNVWVLYPEPNKKTSQLLILRRTLLECLILWLKGLNSNTRTHKSFSFRNSHNSARKQSVYLPNEYIFSSLCWLKNWSILRWAWSSNSTYTSATKQRAKEKTIDENTRVLETGRLYDGCIIG